MCSINVGTTGHQQTKQRTAPSQPRAPVAKQLPKFVGVAALAASQSSKSQDKKSTMMASLGGIAASLSNGGRKTTSASLPNNNAPPKSRRVPDFSSILPPNSKESDDSLVGSEWMTTNNYVPDDYVVRKRNPTPDKVSSGVKNKMDYSHLSSKGLFDAPTTKPAAAQPSPKFFFDANEMETPKGATSVNTTPGEEYASNLESPSGKIQNEINMRRKAEFKPTVDRETLHGSRIEARKASSSLKRAVALDKRRRKAELAGRVKLVEQQQEAEEMEIDGVVSVTSEDQLDALHKDLKNDIAKAQHYIDTGETDNNEEFFDGFEQQD